MSLILSLSLLSRSSSFSLLISDQEYISCSLIFACDILQLWIRIILHYELWIRNTLWIWIRIIKKKTNCDWYVRIQQIYQNHTYMIPADNTRRVKYQITMPLLVTYSVFLFLQILRQFFVLSIQRLLYFPRKLISSRHFTYMPVIMKVT